MTAIITCAGLTKTYQNGVTAPGNLTLTIEEGMSFGLMGENGAPATYSHWHMLQYWRG